MALSTDDPPAPHAARAPLRGTGTRARIGIGMQVAGSAILATIAVLLVTWLSERHGLRVRFDLTHTEENTLDPVSLAVIDKLPADVTVDVFFTACEPPLQQVGALAQDKLRHLLLLAHEHPGPGGHIEVVEHDLSDRAHLDARAEERRRELNIAGIDPGGLVAVSIGARHEILRLRGDIADLDPGNSDAPGPPMPPRLVHFRGEEALVSALLKASLDDAPKVVFSKGHGERDTRGGEATDVARLVQALTADGFKVETWDGAKSAKIPDDASVLAILGPEQPFSAGEYESIRTFLEGGGRVFATLGYEIQDGDQSLARLLAQWGIKPTMRGFVALPLATATNTPLYESVDCAKELYADGDSMPAMNPITEPLRRANRRVYLPMSRAIERGDAPAGARILELLRSPDGTWLDLPAPGLSSGNNWKPDENEEKRRFTLAMQAMFAPLRPVPASRTRGDARAECRVVALGTTYACANALFDFNRDFLLNAFNWLAKREYRVNVSKQSPEARRMDVTSGSALATVNFVAFLLLPILCLAAGLYTAWRRMRR